jgi:hypothetical protein
MTCGGAAANGRRLRKNEGRSNARLRMVGRHLRFCSSGVFAAVALTVGGCIGGDGLPRQPLSGSVTFGGERIKDGVITFFPVERVINGTMVMAGVPIEDGRFSVSRSTGLVPGKYKITVHSGDRNDAARRPGHEPRNENDVPRERIPTKFNSDTMLEILITNHAIKEMKIDLPSK